MNKIQVSDEIKKLIQETCEEYKIEFKKHRKSVTHYSKHGYYQEWESYKTEYRGEI